MAWWGKAEPKEDRLPVANWYPDPADASRWRYWDGAAWTEHYAPRDQAVIPPSSAVAIGPTPDMLPTQQNPERSSASGVPSLAEVVARMRLEVPRHPLDEQVELAGETHHIKGIRKLFREHKMPIHDGGSTLEDLQCMLVPEPWNPYDPNAVAVMIGSHQVGHLPAELARDYARPLARLASSGLLATGVARVWAKTDAGVARARVTVLIPEAQQF